MIKDYSSSFNVDKIVEYLMPYTAYLDKSFVWKTPNDMQIKNLRDREILSSEQSDELLLTINSFERNAKLKQTMACIFATTPSVEIKKEIYEWIVKDWGGISVKYPDKLYYSVETYLYKGTKKKIDNIASVSKVLSFICPEKYIICDARVSYALNWILLKTCASNFFFTMPEGRNSKLNSIDITSLIRLSNINNYSQNLGRDKMISYSDKKVFIDKSMSYPVMCDLIASINNRLWTAERRKYPFYTEMLIFSLADTVIFSDILNSCSLNIV